MVNIVGAVFLRPDQVIGCKNHAPSPQFYPFFIFLNFIGISRKNVLFNSPNFLQYYRKNARKTFPDL